MNCPRRFGLRVRPRVHQIIGPLIGQLVGLVAAMHMTAAARANEDVPFITTPDNVTVAMLQLAGVGKHDHVIDLGSGDGRIVITAARRFGATGLGVEIDPQLVERSRNNAAAAGVTRRAEFREQDLFKTDLGRASVITMYLLPEVNMQLRPALLALKPGTRIVSHDWDLGDWAPDRTLTIDAPSKTIGREKLSRLHLWVVPARVEGIWCGPGGRTLELVQQHQRVNGTAIADAQHSALAGRIDGARMVLLGHAGRRLHLHLHLRPSLLPSLHPSLHQSLRLAGEQWVVKQAGGALARWRGATLVRNAAGACR